MELCVLGLNDFYEVIGKVLEEFPVMGPVERKDQPGHFLFTQLERAQDLATSYVTTVIPPKKVFFQTSETLYRFTEGAPPELRLISDVVPFALACVHPCDLAGLSALDHAFAYPPPEARWAADRKLATVIGVDCMPDDYCFCSSLDTIEFREGCDLFLTPIARGFLVEIHTTRGRDFLNLGHTHMKIARKGDTQDAEAWREAKRVSIRRHLDEPVERVAEALEAGGLGDVWREVADRCYSCGSCNTTCPTCFCFDMHDEFDLSLKSGLRRRTWDSCQLPEFALVAGRHNFREDRGGRVRHRWRRKFLYLYKRLGIPYCTGCGRCSRACVADINLVDVTNMILAHGRKEAPRV